MSLFRQAPASSEPTVCPVCCVKAVERRRVREAFDWILMLAGAAGCMLVFFTAGETMLLNADALAFSPGVKDPEIRLLPYRTLLGFLPALGLFSWGAMRFGAERLRCVACGWTVKQARLREPDAEPAKGP